MLQVTCAIMEHANKILICQRSASMKLPLKWEFQDGRSRPRSWNSGNLKALTTFT
ncbi:hypothetical protein [Sphingobacterium sp. UBA7625]|uniref:hypothetical protein n=1 Tax=Sphingobacterium sp. UBA7625 TaxID=1947522 RepID=UPI00257EAEE7|nr:hypothetical protein [Sphingobacterium sp. UBA7625]